MTDRDSEEFEALMRTARAETAPPREALLDRIMADADGVLAQRAAPAPAPRRPLGAVILAALGGWSAVSGLAAATVAGLWIGVAPPQAISTLGASVWGATVEVPLMETDIAFGLEG